MDKLSKTTTNPHFKNKIKSNKKKEKKTFGVWHSLSKGDPVNNTINRFFKADSDRRGKTYRNEKNLASLYSLLQKPCTFVKVGHETERRP